MHETVQVSISQKTGNDHSPNKATMQNVAFLCIIDITVGVEQLYLEASLR